jgi:hypothetical protein
VAATEEGEESKQVQQEGDHRARILSGSEPTDQPLGRRTEFWRRTGPSARPGRGEASARSARASISPPHSAGGSGRATRASGSSLDKDAPGGRPIEPPSLGRIIFDSRSRWPASSLCRPGGVVPHKPASRHCHQRAS